MDTKDEKFGEEMESESIRQAKKISKNLENIYAMCTKDDEFRKIWQKVPETSKLYFIKDMAKYFTKEKGKESDTPPEDIKSKTTQQVVEDAMEAAMRKLEEKKLKNQ